MEPGKKYRIIHKAVPGVWNLPREMVFKFVIQEGDTLVFSARPLAGTEEMKRDHIQAIWEVADDTPIMLPRIWRGEKRVL